MGIRWDAVVDLATVDIGTVPPPTPRFVIDQACGPIAVDVRLFGALASCGVDRSFRLELPAHATIADVFVRLGERFGEPFLALLLDETGAKRRYCRLFVDGYPVEGVNTPLSASADPSEIEIILLVAPEGG
jgi:hypothetical protein